MAIGDTVQAGLMRIDTSAYERAGQANANANMAFGNALNQVAKGFIEGREKRARADEMTGYLMNQGVAEKDAKAIAKNPFLQKEYQRKKGAEQQMEIEKGRLAAQAASRRSAEKIAGDKASQVEAIRQDGLNEKDLIQAEADELKANQMEVAEALLAETPDPAVLERRKAVAQFDYNQSQPGLFALGGDQGARNRFLEYQRDEAPKVNAPTVLGGELGSSNFLRYAREQNLDPVLAVNRFMKLQKEEDEAVQNDPSISRVGNELNPETGEYEQIARDKFGNPIANYGPPKPSGMYRTPKEARDEEILVGRTKDAMEFNKISRDNSNIAISQAEQAQQALKYLPETTGGLTSFVNEMKVIAESLGIDLPEGYQKDMADIGAFRQLTGQFLFDAMSNTKGAITEREMVLFRQIAPDIDNSRAANKLMLEIYVKGGDRAKKRRDLIRDLQRKDVDPRQIQIAIEDFDGANSFMDDIRSLPRKTNQNSQAQPIRLGVRGGNPPPNSNAQTVNGFKILKK